MQDSPNTTQHISIERPKYIMKDALIQLTTRISTYNAPTVADELEKYRDTIPGKSKDTNTFEMIALYQRAMQLFDSTITVDGRFSTKTYSELKNIQSSFGFIEKNKKKIIPSEGVMDGFPGPITTKVIIAHLRSLTPSVPLHIASKIQTTETIASEKEVQKNIKTTEIETKDIHYVLADSNWEPLPRLPEPWQSIHDLMTANNFIKQANWSYLNEASSLTITIQDGKVISTLGMSRWWWKIRWLNQSEKWLTTEIAKIFSTVK